MNCVVCNKRAFPAESRQHDGKQYHSSCFTRMEEARQKEEWNKKFGNYQNMKPVNAQSCPTCGSTEHYLCKGVNSIPTQQQRPQFNQFQQPQAGKFCGSCQGLAGNGKFCQSCGLAL